MAEISTSEKGSESGHQTVEELIAINEAQVDDRQNDVRGLYEQIRNLKLQIAEISGKIVVKDDEINKLSREIADTITYRDNLVEFVDKLRKQSVGDLDYANIVNGLFNPDQPPVVEYQYERSLTPKMKHAVIQSVLATTGLTMQEGRELVEKQSIKRKLSP